MKRILVAVDGSEASARAAHFAAELAIKTGAELTVATAMEPMMNEEDLLAFSYAGFEQLREQAAREILATHCGKLVPRDVYAGLRLVSVILRGKPAEALAQHAKEGGFDLLAVGSKGRGSVARVWVGSVTDRLVHISQVPVVVVP